MKALLTKLFKRRAKPVPTPDSVPVPNTAFSKRRNGKKRRPAPKGARHIDPNRPIIQQTRGE